MRDRLAELKAEASSFQRSQHTQDQQRTGTGNGNGESNVKLNSEILADASDTMADFFVQIDDIKSMLNELERLVNEMPAKHEELLQIVSRQKQTKLGDDLDRIAEDVTILGQRVRKALKDLSANIMRSAHNQKEAQTSAESRISAGQHANLVQRFMSIMTKFNDIQMESKKRYTEQIRRQCKIVNKQVSESQIEAIIETGNTDGLFTGKRLGEAEQALSEIHDRHDAMIQLEKNLSDLHEMFLDMALLVESQNELLDNILRQVEKASSYSGRATEELLQSTKYAKKIRNKKIFVGGIAGVILTVAGVSTAAAFV